MAVQMSAAVDCLRHKTGCVSDKDLSWAIFLSLQLLHFSKVICALVDLRESGDKSNRQKIDPASYSSPGTVWLTYWIRVISIKYKSSCHRTPSFNFFGCCLFRRIFFRTVSFVLSVWGINFGLSNFSFVVLAVFTFEKQYQASNDSSRAFTCPYFETLFWI